MAARVMIEAKPEVMRFTGVDFKAVGVRPGADAIEFFIEGRHLRCVGVLKTGNQEGAIVGIFNGFIIIVNSFAVISENRKDVRPSSCTLRATEVDVKKRIGFTVQYKTLGAIDAKVIQPLR